MAEAMQSLVIQNTILNLHGLSPVLCLLNTVKKIS
jgi:hypothetical protein